MAEPTKTPPPAQPAAKPPEHKPNEAKTASGMSSTYSSGQNKPASTEDKRGDTFLTHDEIHSLAGDIKPGQLGFLKLDEEGKPSGSVVTELKDVYDESPKASVIANPQHVWDDIVTPSGAPVTKFMNPDPVLWDAGMLKRNPPPKDTDDRGLKTPAGGGVVNQPVRV